jgi:hypothetical protein
MEDNITFRHLIGGYSPFATGLFCWFAIPTISLAFSPSQGAMLFITFFSIVGGIAASIAMEKIMTLIGWR